MQRLTLGRLPEMSLADARAAALALRVGVSRGEDPIAARKAEAEARRAAERADADTVAAVGAEWAEALAASPRSRATVEGYRRQFSRYVLPVLGSRRVAEVAFRDVEALHRSVGRAHPTTANRVVAMLSSFFTWCARRGILPPGTNPARGVERFREAARERFLSPAELARLGEALLTAEREGLPSAPARKFKGETRKTRRRSRAATAAPGERAPVRAPRGAYARTAPPRLVAADRFAVGALRFAMFTGWRINEVCTLRWDAIDAARGVATLGRTKTGRSVRPLGAPALALLADLPRGGSPFVFPSPSNPARPITKPRRLWEAVRHAAGLGGVRLHDLRHSFAAVSAGGGESLLVIGKLLGHKSARTTARYAHLADDVARRAADAAAGAIAAALDAHHAADAAPPAVLPLRARGGSNGRHGK